jgi:hypothetical protein
MESVAGATWLIAAVETRLIAIIIVASRPIDLRKLTVRKAAHEYDAYDRFHVIWLTPKGRQLHFLTAKS